VTDAAERVKAVRADWSTYCRPGEDLRPAVYARHRLLDAVPWLLDQLDRSVSREAAALATPPGRAARLEALADALAASDPAALNSREDGVCALCRAEDNDGSGQYVDLADPAVHKAHCPWRTAKALAARDDAGQEAPDG
jgi:hypothetical protein